MTIYKCDKCGARFKDQKDLLRIRMVSERYNGEWWQENHRTKYYDVCEECEKYLLVSFGKQFKIEEGAEMKGGADNE